MENYTLNTNDFELINKLIKLTSSIDTLYKKMYELEINDKKQTEEYQKTLDSLSGYLDLEKRLYDNSNLDFSKCIAIVKFIINKKMPDEILNDVESIMQQDYNNRILRRMLNIFSNKILENYETIKEMLPKEIINFMEQIEIPDSDKVLSQTIYSSIELEKAFEKDMLNGFLVFLQEFIEGNDYKNYKNDLICAKYNTAFITKSIENDLINNNFDISKNFYINSRLVADLTKMDLELYNMLKNSYGLKESNKQISEILKIGDMDYSELKKVITSIFRQCLLRVNLLLMNDEFIENVNNDFYEYIKDGKYLDRHSDDRISKQLIINCFNSVETDKNKPFILSLGYRK